MGSVMVCTPLIKVIETLLESIEPCVETADLASQPAEGPGELATHPHASGSMSGLSATFSLKLYSEADCRRERRETDGRDQA